MDTFKNLNFNRENNMKKWILGLWILGYSLAAQGGVISPQQAERSLRLLLDSGFVERSEGSWRLKDPVLDTGLANFSHSQMQRLHSALLNSWSQNLGNFCPKGQELGVLNIPLRSEVVQLGTYLISFREKEEA